jgi:HEAT repeat protein
MSHFFCTRSFQSIMDERQKLQSEDLGEREAAAESLSQMGADAAAAAVELVMACADQESVQQWAVAALEELGPPPTDSIPQLTKLVSSNDPLTAYWAITLLGRAEDSATTCQDELATALNDSATPNVRERAAWALGKIHATSPIATAALEKAVNSDQPRLARLAKTALEQSKT